MQIKFALFVVSAYLMNGIFAQSVVGTHEIQATSEQSATATTVPEIGIPPPFTMTAYALLFIEFIYELILLFWFAGALPRRFATGLLAKAALSTHRTLLRMSAHPDI